MSYSLCKNVVHYPIFYPAKSTKNFEIKVIPYCRYLSVMSRKIKKNNNNNNMFNKKLLSKNHFVILDLRRIYLSESLNPDNNDAQCL